MRNILIKVVFLTAAGLIPTVSSASKKSDISKKNVGLLISRFEPKEKKIQKLLKLGSILNLLEGESKKEEIITEKETETTSTNLNVGGKKYGLKDLTKKSSEKGKGIAGYTDNEILNAYHILFSKFFDGSTVSSWNEEDSRNVVLDLLLFLDQKTDQLLPEGEKLVKKYLANYSLEQLKLLFNLLNYFEAPVELLKFVEKLLIEKWSTKFLNQGNTFEKIDKDGEKNELFFSETNFGEIHFLESEFDTGSQAVYWTHLTFGPSDEVLVSDGNKNITSLLDSTGNKIQQFDRSSGGFIAKGHFSPDGNYLVIPFFPTNKETVTFIIRNLKNKTETRFEMAKSSDSYFFDILFPTNKTFVIRDYVEKNSVLRFISLETGKEVKKLEYKDIHFDHFFLNKSRSHMILVEKNIFRVLDLKTWELGEPFKPWGKEPEEGVEPTSYQPLIVGFSENGTFVLLINEEGSQTLWRNNEQNKELKFFEPLLKSTALFSPDEKYIAIDFFDKNGEGVRVFDIETQKLIFETKADLKHPHQIQGFTQNGKFFLTGVSTKTNHSVFVWDIATIDKETGQWKLVLKEDFAGGAVHMGFASIALPKGKEETYHVIHFSLFNFNSTAQRLAFKILKDAESQKRTLKVSSLSELGMFISQLPDDVRNYFIKKNVLVWIPDKKKQDLILKSSDLEKEKLIEEK